MCVGRPAGDRSAKESDIRLITLPPSRLGNFTPSEVGDICAVADSVTRRNVVRRGSGIAIGIALGAGVGAAFGHVAIGAGIGVALGFAFGVAWESRRS